MRGIYPAGSPPCLQGGVIRTKVGHFPRPLFIRPLPGSFPFKNHWRTHASSVLQGRKWQSSRLQIHTISGCDGLETTAAPFLACLPAFPGPLISHVFLSFASRSREEPYIAPPYTPRYGRKRRRRRSRHQKVRTRSSKVAEEGHPFPLWPLCSGQCPARWHTHSPADKSVYCSYIPSKKLSLISVCQTRRRKKKTF